MGEASATCMGVFTLRRQEVRTQAQDFSSSSPPTHLTVSTIEAPDWVNVLAFTKEGLCLLVRQFRFGIWAPTLEVPGGTIDAGETPEEAAYIGDSPADIQAAKAAGVCSVAVTWGVFDEATLSAEKPDKLVHTIPELLEVLGF